MIPNRPILQRTPMQSEAADLNEKLNALGHSWSEVTGTDPEGTDPPTQVEIEIVRDFLKEHPGVFEATVDIAGHKYGLRFDGAGRILETMCEGRWDWSSVPTGSEWLDGQFAKAARNWLIVNDINLKRSTTGATWEDYLNSL